MKKSTIILLLLLCLTGALQAQVIIKDPKLNKICRARTLNDEPGSQIVYKDLNRESKAERWYAIANVNTQHEARLAFGPVRYDDMKWLCSGVVAARRGEKFTVLKRQVNGKFAPSLENYKCRDILVSGQRPDGRQVLLVKGVDGKYRWTDGAGELFDASMSAYSSAELTSDGREIQFIMSDGNRVGIMDVNADIVFPFEYDAIKLYKFPRTSTSNQRLPLAYIAVKGGRAGFVGIKGNVLLPLSFDPNSFGLLAMFYPELSFSVFTWNKYRMWEKGEFESEAEFAGRTSNPQLAAAYIESILPVAEKAFIASKTGPGSNLILSRYDTQTDSFLFSHNQILQDTYSLCVPRAEAPMFKDEFNSIRDEALATASYFICSDMLSLKSITFTTSEGKTYTYENPAALGYDGPSITDLGLMPVK